MENLNKEIDNVLRYDALLEAEKVTGSSYKEDKDTSFLGFLLMMGNNEKKRHLLESSGDTYYSMEIDKYISIVEKLGFKKICYTEFENENAKDALYIFFHYGKGLLLSCDTFENKIINDSNLYYNFKPHDVNNESWWDCVSSGHMTQKGVWVGNHNVKDGLKYCIEKFEQYGVFLQKWVETSRCLSLNHYMDKSFNGGEFDYKEYGRITNKNLQERLPNDVKEIIGV